LRIATVTRPKGLGLAALSFSQTLGVIVALEPLSNVADTHRYRHRSEQLLNMTPLRQPIDAATSLGSQAQRDILRWTHRRAPPFGNSVRLWPNHARQHKHYPR
jgi:hypothetical protein